MAIQCFKLLASKIVRVIKIATAKAVVLLKLWLCQMRK